MTDGLDCFGADDPRFDAALDKPLWRDVAWWLLAMAGGLGLFAIVSEHTGAR